MRAELKRYFNATLLFSLFTAMTFSFQNCGNLQAIDEEELDSTMLSPCSGSACTQSKEKILIKIGNEQTILLYPYAGGARDVAFDVGGFCDSGGFERTRIDWRLQNAGFMTVAQGPMATAPENQKIRCDENGRFNFRVNLPAGYDYSRHLLTVTLLGVDEFSNEVGNPLTLNTDTRPVQLYTSGLRN